MSLYEDVLRRKYTDEEDEKIFSVLSSAIPSLEVDPRPDWLASLCVGDVVWLIEFNKWATIVVPWTGMLPGWGSIQLVYDSATYEWYVSPEGKGHDGTRVLKPYSKTTRSTVEEARFSEVRSMVMVDVGEDWKDVLSMLRDPMDVDGAKIGDRLWIQKGHSGNDEAILSLVYATPSMNYTGKSGDVMRVPARFHLYLTLSFADGTKYEWDVAPIVVDDIRAFKAFDVMVSLCEDRFEPTNGQWAVLS